MTKNGRVAQISRHLTSGEVKDRFDASNMTEEEVLESMKVNGYCIVENFLSKERVDAIHAELTAICDGIEYGRNSFEGYGTKRIYALFAKTRQFDDLAIDPLVMNVVEGVLQTSYVALSAPVGIQIGKNEKQQVFHRDDGKYPLPTPHQEVIVNSMWALDDFTEDNGATLFVPKSHRMSLHNPSDIHERNTKFLQGYGKKEEGEGAEVKKSAARGKEALDAQLLDKAVKAIMPRGSVMFYAGSLYHCGGQNTTDKTRLGVILEYVASWLRPNVASLSDSVRAQAIQENHVLAVPKEVAKDLPPRLQDLLGYDVHPPFLGYVDGRDPKRFLK